MDKDELAIMLERKLHQRMALWPDVFCGYCKVSVTFPKRRIQPLLSKGRLVHPKRLNIRSKRIAYPLEALAVPPAHNRHNTHRNGCDRILLRCSQRI